MGKSVRVKAPTVESAVDIALEELGLKLEDVEVDVIVNPGSGVYGLKNRLAEVCVTQLQVKVPVMPSGTAEAATGARIIGKRVEVVADAPNFPVIIPKNNVTVLKNGVAIKDRFIAYPEDDIRIRMNDEISPPQFSITLIEQNIIAIIRVTPGMRIKRTLQNTDFSDILHIEAHEEIELFNNLEAEQIIEKLSELGITERLNLKAIEEATETLIDFEAIVARGHLPVEGINGDIQLYVKTNGDTCNKQEKVDYREMNRIISVQKNERIAAYLPAVAGVDGMDLFGNKVPTDPVQDLDIRLGDHVEMRDNEIYALSSGIFHLENHGSYIKIDVQHEYIHEGNVDLSSGNIRFTGDVMISKDVTPSMCVSATGKVCIGGSVRKATIESEQSAYIEGNVFSSTVTVGKKEADLSEISSLLQGLIVYFEQIAETIRQIIHIRGIGMDEIDAGELKDLFRIILKDRYFDYQKEKQLFLQKVDTHQADLAPEWTDFISKLDGLFTDTSLTIIRNAAQFEEFLDNGRVLYSQISAPDANRPVLKLPYAVNSILSCSGIIDVTEKGLHNCTVSATEKVFIEGVCRGGEVYAEQKVSIQEAGSSNGVKTVIKTGEGGIISIGLAHYGTEIWLGERVYHFYEDKLGVHARIVGDELLVE